ncbi:GTP-binding protein A [Gigaspora margarita]|uniref:GTP-binding protein A n=1 Tax=Gigaspora margarita TaxID=4874 RepID=A0A8H4AZX1_GIGMA|nr:GTP-binding protein A [Gigaspora margarita]
MTNQKKKKSKENKKSSRIDRQDNEMIEIPFVTNKPNLVNHFWSKRSEFNYSVHEGVKNAYNAIENNLSPNHAYIILFGLSGAGKSSTINNLFDKELAATGSERSQTKVITEFKCEINDSRIGIKNLGISIIDGPGLEDSKGVQEDAKNILCYKQFLENHPQLCSVRPNIIMIVANVNDKRLGDSENMETPFARMLKGIKNCLNILDYKRPSVIFVLTNLQSLPKKTLKEDLSSQINLVKELSSIILGISNPPVVAFENRPEDCDLQRENEWYILGNGERQPLNLFEALINLCEKSKDNIGQEAISKYFSRAAQIEPKVFDFKLNEDIKEIKKFEMKLSEIKLGMENSEIIKKIEQAFSLSSTELKNELGDRMPLEITNFLRANHINTINEIPHGDKFLELFAKYPRHSVELLTFLKQALQREAKEICIEPEVGKGYNVFKDKIVGPSMFQLGKYVMCPTGFKVPRNVQVDEEMRLLFGMSGLKTSESSSAKDY